MPILAWEGPSRVDRSPVIVLITGYKRASKNEKTGPMIQSWILPRDLPPHAAQKTGADVSVCGQCPLRGGSCYVITHWGPFQAWKSWNEGNVDPLDAWDKPMPLRIGAYGDPAAVPASVWTKLLNLPVCTGRTAYTHHWRLKRGSHLKGLAMASVETVEGGRDAVKQGWKYFRAGTDGAAEGEIECPHYSRGVQCADCKLCDGSKANIYVDVHGSDSKKLAFSKLRKNS